MSDADCRVADDFKCVHDACSAGQSDRPWAIHCGTAKTIQEVITLVVFSIFSVVYLKEALKWNYVVGFVLIVVAVFVIFKEW